MRATKTTGMSSDLHQAGSGPDLPGRLAGLGPALGQAAAGRVAGAGHNEARRRPRWKTKNSGSTLAEDRRALFRDGRFAAAAELAARLRAAALARGDEAGATSALIREVQAKVGLGATEEALQPGCSPPRRRPAAASSCSSTFSAAKPCPATSTPTAGKSASAKIPVPAARLEAGEMVGRADQRRHPARRSPPPSRSARRGAPSRWRRSPACSSRTTTRRASAAPCATP